MITDIFMPEREGLETIFELRRKYPKLKIIAISGGGRFGPDGYLPGAKLLGANMVFQKPLDHKEFLEAVASFAHQIRGKYQGHYVGQDSTFAKLIISNSLNRPTPPCRDCGN